jgi:GTP diphosphokinase / guanosine-3',5'-bis(diphosphate) 3'-diphosphatase
MEMVGTLLSARALTLCDDAFLAAALKCRLAFLRERHVNQIIFALAFAADRHRNQRRKDAQASPYINHPIALANVLANEGNVTDERVLLAAILHDTLEDTDTLHDELMQTFGHEVAKIVAEVTDDKTLSKEERKRLQIEHARHLSAQAKLVKLADKICNLRDIVAMPPVDWSADRKRQYLDWAKRVVDEMRGVHPVLEALFDAVYVEGHALV